MRKRIGTLAAAAIAAFLLLLAAPVPEAIAVYSWESLPTYAYDGQHRSALVGSDSSECGHRVHVSTASSHDAVDRWPYGASARSAAATARVTTGDTNAAKLALGARSTTTTGGQAGVVHGESRALACPMVAANAARSFGQFGAADIRAAAGAADRGGLTRVGRALQKHSDRSGSVFGGLSSGNPIARNEQGMRVLDEILEDPGSTTQVLDNVTNTWDSTGQGVRINNDGTCMGLLEPLP